MLDSAASISDLPLITYVLRGRGGGKSVIHFYTFLSYTKKKGGGKGPASM